MSILNLHFLNICYCIASFLGAWFHAVYLKRNLCKEDNKQTQEEKDSQMVTIIFLIFSPILGLFYYCFQFLKPSSFKLKNLDERKPPNNLKIKTAFNVMKVTEEMKNISDIGNNIIHGETRNDKTPPNDH